MFVSGADIQDCFYAARISQQLSEFFCLLSDLEPSEAQVVFGDKFVGVEPGHRISPCITVLPMGFSWSFYLIQKLHEQSALRSLGIDRQGLILDGYPVPRLSDGGAVAMPYCDNVHSVSLDREECQQGKQHMVDDLSNMGFALHEEVDATDFFQTLGGIIDGHQGKVKPTPTRAWNIILAFESLLDVVVHWDTLQRLLGHAMTICTINRSGMCVFRSLYDFVENAPPPRRLNAKERREVQVFIGIVPLLVGNLRRPWSPTITCSDASPVGYGVCQRDLTPNEVHDMGAWQDRWRFRHLPPEEWRPRDRASGLDPLRDVETARVWEVPQTIGDLYAYNHYFPEIPQKIMEPEKWETKLMGKWSDSSDHITVKEGKALVLAVKRLSRSSRSRGMRHLILLDSFSLCLAVCKGRASSFKLLRVTQQLAALSLAGGFTIRTRWVRSESNVADGPSRGSIKPGPYQKYPLGEDPLPSQEARACDAKVSCEASWPLQSFASGQGHDGGEEGEKLSEEEPAFGGSSSFAIGEVPEDNCQPEGGGFGRSGELSKGKWLDTSGEEISDQSNRESVRNLLPEVLEFLPGEWARGAARRSDRRQHVRIHGQALPRGKSSQRRREDPGSRRIPARLPKRQDGSQSKVVAGLAKRNAAREPHTSSQADSVRPEHGVDFPAEKVNGSEGSLGLRHLHEARGVYRPQKEEHHSSGEGSGAAIPLDISGGARLRRPVAGQGGGLRQFNPFGQRRAIVAGKCVDEAGSQIEVQRGLHLRFHCRGVSQRAGASEHEAWAEGGSTPIS